MTEKNISTNRLQAALATAAGGFAWAAVAVSFTWDYSTAFGSCAAGVGAFVGVFIGLCIRNRFLKKCLNTGMVHLSLLGLFVALVLFLPALLMVWSPFSLEMTLLLVETLDIGVKALILVAVIRVIGSTVKWFAGIEGLLAVLAFARIADEHRHRISRPYWMVDLGVERGWQAESVFFVVGAVATAVLVLILFSHSEFSRLRLRRQIVGGCATLFLLYLTGLWLASVMPPFPPSQIPPPPPPEMQQDSPPPEPPPPELVAVVELQDKYMSTERMKALYFREQCYSRLDGSDLVASDNTNLPWQVWSGFPAEAWVCSDSVLCSEMTNVAAVVRARVHHVNAPQRPFGLVSPVAYTPIDDSDRRFTRSYEVVSVPPGKYTPDLSHDKIFQKLSNDMWTDDAWAHYIACPTNQQIGQIVDEIIKDIKPSRLKLPAIRVRLVRSWVNKNLTLSSQAGATAGTNSILTFLSESRIGGWKQFSHATVLLLRAMEVPSRLAAGYRYPVAEKEVKDVLRITDGHYSWWPEVYVSGSGWVPLTLAPENIIDQSEPPPEPDLEQELTRSLNKTPEKSATDMLPGADRVARTVGIVVLVTLFVLYMKCIVWRRVLRPHVCGGRIIHRVCYSVSTELIGEIGFTRTRMESWNDFSTRLLELPGKPAFAREFATLTAMYQKDHEQEHDGMFDEIGCRERRRLWLLALRRHGWAVTRYALSQGIWRTRFRPVLGKRLFE